MKVVKPRIPPLRRDDCSPEQRKLLDDIGPAGNMNAFKTIVRHPTLFRHLVCTVMYIMQESTIPKRDTELLILRTAWLCGAEYEWSNHSVSGKRSGLSDEEILRVTKGPKAKGWTPSDAALLSVADELHNKTRISDAMWNRLAKKYTQQQLIDIVFTVAYYNLASMLLNSLGVELDQNVTGFPNTVHSDPKHPSTRRLRAG